MPNFIFSAGTLALCLTFMLTPYPASAQPPKAFKVCQGKQTGDNCQIGPGIGQCTDHGQGPFCLPHSHMQGQGNDGPPPRPDADTDMSQVGRPTQGQGQNKGRGNSMQAKMQKGRGPNKYPAPGTKQAYEETDPIRTGGGFDTAQTLCFDTSKVISCPEPGEKYYGQDAQYQGMPLSFASNGDGTITDHYTGLLWQKAHNDTRRTQTDAVRYCSNLELSGYDDWRLPNAKEAYSIVTFDGAAGVKAYLDTGYFDIEPPASLDKNDRFSSTHKPEMMGQTWTSTIYKGNLWGRNQKAAFFMNYLDGRIKCAGIDRPKQFYRCVRGEEYGANEFQANGDGTVTDHSSGLIWQEADDGTTRNWPEALAYCEDLTMADQDDWRLPNAKELQYVLDYTRIPATPKELIQSDPKAWYWTSTTLGDATAQGVYICFGKGVSEDGVDVHGAGAQRSDPKTTRQKHGGQQGGQQDEIRVDNLVRCIRN